MSELPPIRRIDLTRIDWLADLAAECDRGTAMFGGMPLRTYTMFSPHREATDVVLRYPPDAGKLLPGAPGTDQEKAALYQWAASTTDRVDYPAAGRFPLCMRAARLLQRQQGADELGSVVVVRLPPDCQIHQHSDRLADVEAAVPGAIPPALWFDRYHIIIQGRQRLYVYGDDLKTHRAEMEAGQIWWFDNAKQHSVLNLSDTVDRIALIVDLHSNTRPMRRS